ncbi:unnamed protein product [Pleuronectes platessa]|uniref:Uncharacterized protein n=1 Tax=Pleuronectes platessa TaxID=8262 RepID=A0A9N7TG98_PLEPL|nr:unnamed protein product [Pleuronectes platessa]
MDDRKEGSDRNQTLGLVFAARQSIHGFSEVTNQGELECTLLPQWESGSIWRIILKQPPPTAATASPNLTPVPPRLSLYSTYRSHRRSFSWFDSRQNSIPQFHTLSAVDKGPTSAAVWGPQRGTRCAHRMAQNRIPQDNEVHLWS